VKPNGKSEASNTVSQKKKKGQAEKVAPALVTGDLSIYQKNWAITCGPKASVVLSVGNRLRGHFRKEPVARGWEVSLGSCRCGEGGTKQRLTWMNRKPTRPFKLSFAGGWLNVTSRLPSTRQGTGCNQHHLHPSARNRGGRCSVSPAGGAVGRFGGQSCAVRRRAGGGATGTRKRRNPCGEAWEVAVYRLSSSGQSSSRHSEVLVPAEGTGWG
jgi:hypothetical protein